MDITARTSADANIMSMNASRKISKRYYAFAGVVDGAEIAAATSISPPF